MGSGSTAGPAGAGSRVSTNPPGRALPLGIMDRSPVNKSEEPSGVQRAMNVFRAVMPVVQRLLPLA